MKKLFYVVLSLVIALSASLALVGCGSSSQAKAETRVTAEINPKIELMLDANDKVISVTGLNEEGELIISGEAFIGKNVDDALALFVEVSTNAGYVVKGSVTAGDNELDVTISGDTTKAEEIFENVKTKVNAKLEELGVSKLDVKKEIADTISDLRETLLEVNPLFTEEEVANLTEEEIIDEINVIRREAKDIVGKAAKDAYYQARAYELHLAESEQIKALIDDLGTIDKLAASTYAAALDALNAARKTVSDTFVTLFVAEDSAYQTALNVVFEKKQAVLELKNQIANETDAALKEEKLALLTQAEAALDLAEDALENAKELADQAMAEVLSALDTAEKAVKDAYATISTILPNLKESIEGNAKAIDKAVNNAKKDAFDKFEKNHGEQIQGLKDAIQGHKDRFNGQPA